MATLADFLPYVLVSVPGCSMPLAEQHIRDTCIDFCSISSVAQHRCDAIDLLPGQIEYDLDTPNGLVAHLILKAWINGQQCSAMTLDDPDVTSQQAAETANSRGMPSRFLLLPTNAIRLNLAPDVAMPQAFRAIVSLKPSRKSANVPDILLTDYADAIANGAIARLMRLPGQLFSNPNWQAYQQLYVASRTNARIRAEQGFSVTGAKILPRRFG